MKKILLILGLLSICYTANAAEEYSFIYLNGSNVNDEKMYNWWTESVQKFHPVFKKKILNDKKVCHWVFRDQEVNITDEPVLFYWGDKSKEDLDFVKEAVLTSKAMSSFLAYKFRDVLTAFLHDAIWVQKSHNMNPILDELNKVVKKEAEQGRKTVLYGYSAGTFITFKYLFNKLRYIDLLEIAKIYCKDDSFTNFVQQNPRQKTCLSAIEASGLGVISSDDKIVFTSDREKFMNAYNQLDSVSENVCAPFDSVKGVVNFASPLVLFYSNISDPEVELSKYNKFLMKHIYENDMFMLNLNYREDPLGFPLLKNATYEQMEARTGLSIENPTGMVYEYSGIWSGRSFALAHTSYYSAKTIFPKSVRKILVKGYRFQYDPKYQEKMLKRDRKKDELL